MHEAYMPKSLHFCCYVDDLVLKVCEGSDAVTLSLFVDSFHEIISDLYHRRLKHSEAKTVVRSKDKALACKAVKRLADLGTVVKANLPVVDRTPVSCGTRRLANQARKRLSSAKGRSARVKWLATRNRKATVLVKTGLIPAITWGFRHPSQPRR